MSLNSFPRESMNNISEQKNKSANVAPNNRVRANNRPTGSKRPRPLPLPYGNKKKESMGDWVYKHRIGLMLTVLIHLSLIIMFLSYQIILRPVSAAQSVTIDMVNEQLLEEQQEIQQEQEDQRTFEDLDIRNIISNENSQLDASLRDDRGSHSQELYEEAQRVQEALSQGSAEYNDGMADIEASRREAQQELERLREQQSGAAGKDDRDERAR